MMLPDLPALPVLPGLPTAAASSSFLAGLSLGASLIVAIGAQNTFVLRQGLRREHVATVVAICTLLDIALMSVGMAGLGGMIMAHPDLLDAAALAGAVTLAWYGFGAFRRACHPEVLMTQAAGAQVSRRRAAGQVLAISLLNPHVYLDTVVLVGTVGAQQAAGTRLAFLAGSALASTSWFVALGFGARVLAPLFSRPRAWQVLDVLVGLTLCNLAIRLALGVLGR